KRDWSSDVSSSDLGMQTAKGPYESSALSSGPLVGPKLTYYLVAVVEPPAASIFSTADLENLSAVTFSLTLTSPSPRTLTGCLARTRPAATMSATATSPPCGNASAKSATLTTW